jgi:hypothetical protein
MPPLRLTPKQIRSCANQLCDDLIEIFYHFETRYPDMGVADVQAIVLAAVQDLLTRWIEPIDDRGGDADPPPMTMPTPTPTQGDMFESCADTDTRRHV